MPYRFITSKIRFFSAVALCAILAVMPLHDAQAQSVSLPDFLTNNSGGEAALPPAPINTPQEGDLDFEKTRAELENDSREQAFDAALQGLLPLRPNEIRKLLEHFDRTQEAVELPVYPSPKPEVSVQTLSLDPGTAPASVNVLKHLLF